ncbi:hypothetical protein K3495_g14436 [Podosphaera aphanis]|nr:hypothetical protein K3495_g14436 [Podosphaera aphanis]
MDHLSIGVETWNKLKVNACAIRGNATLHDLPQPSQLEALISTLHKYYHPDALDGRTIVNEFTVKAAGAEGHAMLKNWKEWVAQEANMRQAIEFNLHPGPVAIMATERVAKDMWAKLKSQYEESGTVLEYPAIQD